MSAIPAHGGDLRGFEERFGKTPLDFSANVNPLGPSPRAVRAAQEALAQMGRYPDPLCRDLVAEIARVHRVSCDRVVCGAGASNLIWRIAQTVHPQRVLVCAPTFSEYERAFVAAGSSVEHYDLCYEDGFALTERILERISEVDAVVLCQPNNPTGLLCSFDLLEKIRERCEKAGSFLLIDECFLGFIDDRDRLSSIPQLDSCEHLVVVRALTKLEGLAGLRVGYALFGDMGLADRVRNSGSPWPLSCAAQAAGRAALEDVEHVRQTRALIAQERPRLKDALERLGCEVIPSVANFLLFHSHVSDLAERLACRGILVRDCANFAGLGPGWVRVCVRVRQDNDLLIEALAQVMPNTTGLSLVEAKQHVAAPLSTKKRRALMVQGTMSNVGKSIICAGLCRVLKRRGWNVAPFKSQNMSLNSGVTPEGLEIGRAQILQAQAAGVAPSALMNPILLKPSGNTGSQVVVRGKPLATMEARAYGAFRPSLTPVVREAFEELADTHDAVIIEGAGSPVEINLGHDDFVNMGMARIAKTPVVLVGDIDPGGVFAQLGGTVALLSPEEQSLVRGIVINKFRGDPSILAPGIAQLEDICHTKVLGVVPWLDLDLDDEDSLSSKLASASTAPLDCLDIAVVRFPHLSNFTDFDELTRHPAAHVRYVAKSGELGRPDLVVLPGTKATMSDLRWLRETGLAACIKALAAHATPVLGICGGYQMLGCELSDPAGQDGGGREEGLALLPIKTAFSSEKRTVNARGVLHIDTGFFSVFNSLAVQGYEIHAGTSEICEDRGSQSCQKAQRPLVLSDGDVGREDGCVCGDVMGTYLHGLLDSREVCDALVNGLRARRGLSPWVASTGPSAAQVRERELDRLADCLEESLDIDAVLELLERGLDER